MDDYGKLPGLRASADPRLREELARVEETGGTPEALQEPLVEEGQNAAVLLESIFSSRRLAGLKEQSDGLFPTIGFEFNPLHFEKVLAFRDDHAESLERCREVLSRESRGFGIDHTRGFGNDLDFVDRVRLCARLEAFDAADQLHARKDLDAAMENIERMLHWAALLAAEKNVYTRGEAAAMREEIASVIVETAHSPDAAPRHTAELAKLVLDALEGWTPDAHAWIGDRAAVLHSYEAIRDGKITRFLTVDEIDALARERSLFDLSKALERSVDSDELFYLQAARRLIDLCGQPYFKRRRAFAEIEMEAERLRGGKDYPLAAMLLFLKDVESGHLLQAHDRALYEALYLALSHAAGKTSDRFRVSPLSGKPYRVRRDGALVVVDGFGPDADGTFSVEVPAQVDQTMKKERF